MKIGKERFATAGRKGKGLLTPKKTGSIKGG